MALNNSEKQEVQRTRLGPGQIGTLLTPESLIPVNEGVAMTLEGPDTREPARQSE